MDTQNKPVKNPTPEERPDLYDDYDYRDLPAGYQTGIKTPDYIQKLIDAKANKPAARDSKLTPNAD
jgi:hypothetical protein